MPTAIAIDFGTSRTKLAYLDEATGRPELMRLGRRDDPFIPSLFYLPRNSEQVFLGDDAEEMLAQDPAGIVEVLKRKLHETHVRANRRRVTPQMLLARLFADLRARAARELPSFGGAPADVLQLTVPAMYGRAQERVLREATQQAGFTEVVLVPEPVAAARAWLAQASAEVPGIVVFDCGGGTVDWAYLRRDGADFHLVPECPPGGDQVGGYDLDRELLARVEDCLDDDALAALCGHEIEYLKMLRIVKERYCRGLPLLPLRIGSSQITLSEADIKDAFEARFIRHAGEGLKGYLTQVRAVAGADQPPVLPVGGSARIKGLREALEQACDCETLWWERADYATVLGAVLGIVAESAPVVSRARGLPSEPKPAPEPEVNQPPAVADALISGRYRDHGDGTVTDVKTGLHWMRCALGQGWRDGTCVGEGDCFEWDDAFRAADDFNQKGGYAGHSDWRVPTIDELKTLIFCSSGKPKIWNDTGQPCEGDYLSPAVDPAAFPATADYLIPAIDPAAFPAPADSWFWSSSPYANLRSYAWYVGFDYGYVYNYSKNFQLYVRLVRRGQ